MSVCAAPDGGTAINLASWFEEPKIVMPIGDG
jgi:hypothetical protein